MAYDTLMNISDLGEGVVQISSQVPVMFPAILMFVWGVIAIGGYFSQERRLAQGNIAMWFTIGGFISTTGGFILFLVDGLINIETIVIFVAITFACAIWYFVASRTDV